MSRRKFKIMARVRGIRGDTIGSFTEDGKDGTPVLWLPDGTLPQIRSDTVTALDRAYQEGREDRSAELIPNDDDAVRKATRDLALQILEDVLGEDPAEWIVLRGGELSYTVAPVSLDTVNGTIDVNVGQGLHRIRIRMLIEEL